MSSPAISGYRLSPRQRHLWRSACTSPPFQVQCAIAIPDAADAQRLQAAFEQIAHREAIFHSSFRLLPGMAAPILTPERAAMARWQVIDDDTDPHALLARERSYELDFNHGPLLRGCLARRSDGSAVLTLSAPSLCADSPTLAVLAQEIAGSRPGDGVSYVQFAAWLNELLESEEGRQAGEHWSGWRAASPAACETAFDLSGSGSRFTPRFRLLAIGPEVLRQLQRKAADLNVSREAIPLACWRLLLNRLTAGAPSIGVILPGRDHPSLATTMGPVAFGSPLPYTSPDTPAESSFAQIALDTEDRLQECRDWGLYFPPGEMDGFSFSWEVWPDLLARYAATERFKLHLSILEIGDRLSIELGYDESTFSSAGADCVAGMLETMLPAALDPEDGAARDLPLLPADTRSDLLIRSYGRSQPVPEATLHQLFEDQARRTPARIAVADEASELSFRELDEAADWIAADLRTFGVLPDQLVGLLAERSVGTIAGLLGILKIGAAYLALDPSQPTGRLQALCAGAGVNAVVAPSGFAQSASVAGLPVVSLAQRRPPQTPTPPEPIAPSGLAYAIYTSGSSGQPKAVAIEHHSAVNLLSALDGLIYAELASPVRIALNAPLTFDASVKQWIRMLRGDTLILVPEEVRYDPQAMLSWLRRQRVAVLDCTPAQLEPLVEAGLLNAGTSELKAVLVGGEAIGVALWKKLAQSRAIRFYNLYGPTECTVDATGTHIHPELLRPVIGHPLHNVAAYVLDERLEPAPPGVAGELFIGGPGVARGYWSAPELTAERFLPDPFAGSPGSRLYRTGDRARWLADGSIEYLGRLDRQMKIRGYRVEPGEIESVLLAHPGVQSASVAAGANGLAAYLVRAPGAAPLDLSGLRSLLRTRLPEFMLPETIAEVPHLPLTPNGKIDYAALPVMARPLADSTPAAAPRNELERTIAAIWCEILGRESVGIEDNFFDVGGHSLLLARLYARLRERLHREFAMIELFRNPTISSFAAFLTSHAAAAESPVALLDRAARQKQAFQERARARGKEA